MTEADRGWVRQFLGERWGSPIVVVHGETFEPDRLPGFVYEEKLGPAPRESKFDDLFVRSTKKIPLGIVTYAIRPPICEIVTLDSMAERQGIGSELLAHVDQAARDSGCARIVLTTTNDNLQALRFYQKRGFRITAIHAGAVDEARKLKPEIPYLGQDGIPLRDELELERPVSRCAPPRRTLAPP